LPRRCEHGARHEETYLEIIDGLNKEKLTESTEPYVGFRPTGDRRFALRQRTRFAFRVDTWTPDGESIVEHVAGVEDYQVALATFRAACERWPSTPITLRQGARVLPQSLLS
jgi:hypothetical protein